jgi:hypothetical protein
MKCPCEECLVRSPCRNHLVKKSKFNRSEYLIIEYAEKCPFIIEYFGVNSQGIILHSHETIGQLCKIFIVPDRQFVWRASSIGIHR